MVHQMCLFVDETKELGKKVCVNYVRGCRAQLEMDYKYTRCGECLRKDREKDKQKRNSVKVALETSCEKTEEVIQEKTCTVCVQTRPMTEFVGQKEGVITKTCKNCRDACKRNDMKRDKKHRYELDKKAENKPERQYNKYMNSARKRDIIFNIDKELCFDLINKPCNYCGELIQGIPNGIDRKISTVGYTPENCVSCCKMCNYMKSCLDDDVFLLRVKHMIEYLKDGKISHPDVFRNCKGINYTMYKAMSKQRKIEFKLSKEEFEYFKNGSCDLCGKENSDKHQNGIDRIDNNICYIVDNCRRCCGECNLMKQEYNNNEFIEKLHKIYEHSILDKEIVIHGPFTENRLKIVKKREIV